MPAQVLWYQSGFYEMSDELKRYQTTKWAKGYRKYDENVSKEEAWIKYSNIIKRICNSFDQKINVLDIGCGTGRFFCSLENVENLCGIDTSQAMLNEAASPHNFEIVKQNVKNTSLLNQDFKQIHEIFPDDSFHFIFSIGMLSEYGNSTFPDVKFFNNLYSIIKKDGIILLSIKQNKDEIMNLINLSKLSNCQQIKTYFLKDDKSNKLMLEIKK